MMRASVASPLQLLVISNPLEKRMSDANLMRAQLQAHANTAGAFPLNFSAAADRQSQTAVTGLEHFSAIFDASAAHGLRQRLACHRVRFQVYCIDNQFEDASEHPDGFETDAYDEHAVHSVLTHRSAVNPIGTVRLVLPYGAGRRRLLPIQTLAPLLASDSVAPFPIDRTGELSRFAVVKSFRQHVPVAGPEAKLSPEDWRKTLLCLPLGLIRACVGLLAQEGMTHVVAVMEPALLRHLSRFGIHFNKLGGLVEHHGQRQPCWADVGALLARTFSEQHDVWSYITDDGRLWPAPLQPDALCSAASMVARTNTTGVQA